MPTPSRLTYPTSRIFKPNFLTRRLFFIASLVICLVLYRAWNNHDQHAEGITSVTRANLRNSRLSKARGFPQKIWFKLGPRGKTEDMERWTNSCITQNPNYQYEFLTDESADLWVQKTFATTRPDIVEVYLNLTMPILKADILRYLLLLVEGGVWMDLDVSCDGVPIDDWIPEEYRDGTSLVLGWEYDAGLGPGYLHQFTIWSLMSKPGVSHMQRVVDDIINSIYEDIANWDITIPELRHEVIGDVLDYTGPRGFTRSILRSLEVTLGEPVDRDVIENIRSPVRIADILILPGYAFSRLMNQYDESEGPVGPILVTHHYAGSWKNMYGGELV